MNTSKSHDATSKPDTIACEICMKEIPKSEAKSTEATDYVRYFCGLDCYEKWKTSKNAHDHEHS